MAKVKANHYTDSLVYAIDRVIKNIKADLNQYISSLDNITAEQFAVLDIISSRKFVYQQDIANILSKDKSNIKRIVDILAKNNFIERKAGIANNRLVYFLEITEDGRKIVDNNMDSVKKHLENAFSCITEEEIASLWNIVHKLEKHE